MTTLFARFITQPVKLQPEPIEETDTYRKALNQNFIDYNEFFVNVLPDTQYYTDRREVISNDKKKIYIIAKNKYKKRWECNCPDWIYRKKHTGGRCKHLQLLVPFIEEA